MLYLVAVFAGILLGLLAKGRLSNVMELKFEKSGWILASFVIQILAQVLGAKGIQWISENTWIIQGVAFFLLLIGFWYNRRYVGVLIVGLGFVMNALVMMLNGGKMPVSMEVLEKAGLMEAADTTLLRGLDIRHCIIHEGTLLAFLGDIMHPPGFLSIMMQIVSIGDVLVVLGLAVLFFEAVTNRKGLKDKL